MAIMMRINMTTYLASLNDLISEMLKNEFKFIK